ncbi:hypothetical protein D3C84_833250 [compost metagenome]
MHVQHQGIFLWHRCLVAVDAVDHHSLDVALINAAAHPVGKLARGQFSGIHLLDHQVSTLLQRQQVDADIFHAFEQQAQLFVEDEQRGFLAPGHGSGGKDHRDQRLARTGRAENQRTGPGLDTATE